LGQCLAVAAAQWHRKHHTRTALGPAALGKDPQADGRVGQPVLARAVGHGGHAPGLGFGGGDFMAVGDHQVAQL